MDFERHLLVDGHNLLHHFPEWRNLLRGDFQAAAAALLAEVRPVHDADRIRVSLVFDGRGGSLSVEQPGREPTLAVIYSPSGMTADDVIEQMVGGAADASLYVVATGDLQERRTVEALGAEAVSPEALREWSARAQQSLSAQVHSVRGEVEKKWRKRGR